MGLEPKLFQKLSQQLVMTPQLRQAIKILQVSRTELESLIETELEENPILEEGQADKTTVAAEPEQPRVDGVMGEVEPVVEAPKGEESAKDLKEIDWKEYFENYGGEFHGASYGDTDPGDDDRRPSLENVLTKSQDLCEYLEWQLRMSNFTAEEERISALVIGNVDSDGYLGASDEEIASLADVEPAKVAEVIAHDACRERIAGAELHELNEQALPEVARADARRVELLEPPQNRHDFVGRDRCDVRDLLDVAVEVTLDVEVADDDLADLLLARREIGEMELPAEVFGELRSPCQHVLERGAPVIVLALGLGSPERVELVLVVVPIVFPIDLAEIARRLRRGRFRRRAIRGGRYDTVELGIHVGCRRVAVVFPLDAVFEHGVLRELFVDQRFELSAGDLENLDGLPQLGCHHQLLRHLLVELGFEGHRQPGFYNRNLSPR